MKPETSYLVGFLFSFLERGTDSYWNIIESLQRVLDSKKLATANGKMNQP